MISIIYYAHSMGIYGKTREREELDIIQGTFADSCIYNPNRKYIQKAKDPMKRCLKIINDASVTALVFSEQRGKVTAGVYLEIITAQRAKKPVYRIFDDSVEEFQGLPKRGKN